MSSERDNPVYKEAYHLGLKAWLDGKNSTDNPYSDRSIEYEYWAFGFSIGVLAKPTNN